MHPITRTLPREGVDIINLSKWAIMADPALVQEVHQPGIPLWVKADTGSRKELEEIIALGVDGIVTGLSELLNE